MSDFFDVMASILTALITLALVLGFVCLIIGLSVMLIFKLPFPMEAFKFYLIILNVLLIPMGIGALFYCWKYL